LSRGVQNIVSGGGALFLAEDPQLQFFSDSLVVSADTQVVEFTSLPDETAVLCSSMGVPCTIQETGQLQGLTITWSGGASADGIFIESDVEPSAVPEPTSGFLLVTGLIGLLGVRLARASGLAALH